MSVISIILQSLLAAYFIFSGIAKVIGAKYWSDIFNDLKLPQWFRLVTGIVQLIGAAALVIGYWYGWAVVWAGIWLGITMLAACLAHLRVKDPFSKTAPAMVFLVLVLILFIMNTNHLMLPLS
ncbi:DoxX family protein [Pseudalkalibacillus salsuginis]|uniref:DoxX family protein n=1 Tax=Pseudalkalibacillus salsuginis TaxID=2910972 RepID=UPI001F300071|nr:DoxX family protein [Pseudalkalibacillus salsuginis]MCF6409479.1 DoxX family protein [Pseudalkalibacillus salsuginis]